MKEDSDSAGMVDEYRNGQRMQSFFPSSIPLPFLLHLHASVEWRNGRDHEEWRNGRGMDESRIHTIIQLPFLLSSH